MLPLSPAEKQKPGLDKKENSRRESGRDRSLLLVTKRAQSLYGQSAVQVAQEESIWYNIIKGQDRPISYLCRRTCHLALWPFVGREWVLILRSRRIEPGADARLRTNMGAQLQRAWRTSSDASCSLTEGELRDLTLCYWQQKDPPGQRIGWYIQHLLPNELDFARRRGALQPHPCHSLALLVGHSPEPLLQAVCVFQPERVVLVLNERYGKERGLSRGQELADWIVQGLEALLHRRPAVDLVEVADRPDTVFQALCEHVLPDRQVGRAVVVDVTGAKKSMVVGAFFFAAYADIPISYVDFDEYDEAYRRPFGYKCRIGTLANPYDAFRLREWEQLRRMYDNYQFRAAVGRLSDLLNWMRGIVGTSGSTGLPVCSLRPEHVEAAEKLLCVLQFYSAWDDGDYARALKMLSSLDRLLPDFHPPTAVSVLGGVWPHTEGTSNANDAARQLLSQHDELRLHPDSILESNELLVTYAADELAKIERLVSADEDNRSALLRAAGLDELLLKARLVRLWQAGSEGCVGLWDQDERFLGKCRTLQDDKLQDKLYEVLLNHQGTDHMRNALQRKMVRDKRLKMFVPAFVRLDVWRDTYRARPLADSPRLADYDKRVGLDGEVLTRLRNQAIHMCLYIPQAIAQSALALARANLAEFVANWLSLSNSQSDLETRDVGRMPWSRLCASCELDFLPLALGREA